MLALALMIFVLLPEYEAGAGSQESELDVAYRSVADMGHGSVYCGLYSFIAAANAVDLDVDCAQVFTGSYISNPSGSNSEDLIRLATDFKLVGSLVHDIDREALRSIEDPVILQLWNENSTGEDNYHWVTYLGTRIDGLHIYDSSIGELVMSDSELARSWTGNGVVISRNRIGCTLIQAGSRIRSFLWAVPPFIFACVVVFVSKFAGKWSLISEPGMIAHMVAIVAFIISWSCVAACIDRDRLKMDDWIRSSACWRSSDVSCGFVRDIPLATVIVDCRTPFDYSQGHICGAVNIPISTSYRELVRICREYDTSQGVLVYCQRAECGWAELMCGRMACLGVKAEALVGGYDRVRQEKIARISNE